MGVNGQSGIRTALVHHWLVAQRGGERVLEALGELFPSADLFTLVHGSSQVPASLSGHRLHDSFLQKLPWPTRWYRHYLPLFPLATESLDLRGYDLVISSDAATVKGVRVSPQSTHICYCHTPMRYIWNGYETYSQAAGPIARLALRAARDPLRAWDYRAAQRVTHFVANSQNVQKRIRDAYERDSVVIYPPVDTHRFVIPALRQSTGDFFLLVSQMVPYKRVDLAIDAFNKCGKPLVVIGEGPDRSKLQRQAGPNIQFLGAQPESNLIDAMQRCKAFVFAGEEDFGIVMAEAQACGAPVIAFGKDGAREIVEDGVTGVFFEEQSTDSLLERLERFERLRFDGPAIRNSALRFGRQRFLREFKGLLNDKMGERMN
jgi:glycosyltransferase involved in cell wall biosynthesis